MTRPIPPHILGRLETLPERVSDLVWQWAEKTPSAPAMLEDDIRWTFAEQARAVRQAWRVAPVVRTSSMRRMGRSRTAGGSRTRVTLVNETRELARVEGESVKVMRLSAEAASEASHPSRGPSRAHDREIPRTADRHRRVRPKGSN